ncbi:unnamed protein product [Ectocarpus sp. 12 AP-2014]
MVCRWTLRSQLPSTPSSSNSRRSNPNTSAAASTMLLPLLMAWAYVLALGEKLQLELESLYSGSKSTASPTSAPQSPSPSPSPLPMELGKAAPASTAPIVAPPAADKSAAAAVATTRTCTSCWSRKLPPSNSSSTTKHKEGLLPPACTTSRARATDKTLVLDLDETLILARGDAREMGEEQRFDFMLSFQHQLPPLQEGRRRSRGLVPRMRRAAARASGGLGNEGQKPRRIYVRKRPHLREFLEAVSEMFEVVLFTAAPEAFATAVLEQIDPEASFVDHVLSRDNCTRLGSSTIRGPSSSTGKNRSSSSSCRTWGGRGVSSDLSRKRRGGPTSMVKDLGIIGRPLSKVIMVDNSLDAIRYHLENGVHISSFYGDREDTDLLSTLDALKTLAPAADVRDGIIRLSVETQARKEGHILTLDDASPK